MRQSRAGGSAGSAAGNLNRKGPSALRPFRYRRGVLPLTDVQTLYSRLMTAIACSMTADLSRARPLRPVGEDGSGYSARRHSSQAENCSGSLTNQRNPPGRFSAPGSARVSSSSTIYPVVGGKHCRRFGDVPSGRPRHGDRPDAVRLSAGRARVINRPRLFQSIQRNTMPAC